MIYALGDSFTYGYGATAGHGYIPVLAKLLNKPITNLGVNGAQVPDQTQNLCNTNITTNDSSILELGTNDHWRYGSNTTKQDYYRRGIQACAAWLGLVDKQKGINNTNTTGTWQNTTSFSTGKMSQTAGSTMTWNVSGTTVYIGTIQYDGNGSSFNINIDGVDMGNFTTGTTGLLTYQNMPCGPRLLRFPNLSPGNHTVVFIALGGGYCYAEWCAGNDSIKSPVYVLNYTHDTAAGYASCPIAVSDTTLMQFNTILASAMNELIADGLNIKLVDNNSLCFPDTDTYSDGVHPNDTGHAKIAMNLWKMM